MTTRYRLDDLFIDVPRQRVERDGVLLDVGGLSFRLLEFLLEQGQRVVGFDELIERVWAPAVVNEETVTQRVRLLRQSLGDDGRNPRYLRSVRGRGYQLCAAPQCVDDTDGDTPPRRGTSRYLMVAGIAIALLAIGAIAWSLQRAGVQHALPPSPLLQRAAYYAGIGQRDDNERAIALYRQRLQEAPDDRDALIGLSRAFSAQVCLYNGEAAQLDRAQALAQRVIAADPDHAAAHAALAYSFDCRGRIDDALRGYERALSLDPANDGARASAAYLYERRGRLADALGANLAVRDPSRVRFLQIQIAANLDLLGYAAEAETRYRRSFQLYPDNVFSNLAWPSFLMRHGRNAEAQAALDEAMKRGTDHAGLHVLAAELAWARGDRDTAWREAARAAELRPQGSFAQSMLWSMSPVQPPAHLLRARADSLREGLRAGSDPFDGLDAALLLTMIGERDSAIDALADAVAMGYRDAAYLRATPLFANLRKSPRFDALIATVDTAIAREREAVRTRKLDLSAAP
ncbi:winged helix-turn-helix domain-containing protein [Lysobacter auxotrophicus]|uniref:Winged helix-turn-helix domain-containing protein n=1 Tax=Lysobacter auxotrophicus TaxID=2992573 RepID=A0ABM8DIJ7_9GAMM|nr:winged helix-turn-helix domain-containing protein [Lysobacter auxotrophicus]BDU18419.1 winged helix-turn-helix domain-containing protein [Lysobacter auxotrophicus]